MYREDDLAVLRLADVENSGSRQLIIVPIVDTED